jgi:hypothetical protein
LRYADHAIALGDGHASAGAADTILAAPALSALFGHPLLLLGEGRARTFVRLRRIVRPLHDHSATPPRALRKVAGDHFPMTMRFASADATRPDGSSAPDDSSRAVGTYLLLCGLVASLLLPTVHSIVSDHAVSAEKADSSVFAVLIVWTAATMLYGAFFYARSPAKIADALFGRHGRLLAGAGAARNSRRFAATITTLAGEEELLWFGYGERIAAIALLTLPLPILLLDTDNRIVHRVLAR